jgi:hypothetical protein
MMPAISRSEIEEAAEGLKELLLRFCGGRISVQYLDAQNREIEVVDSSLVFSGEGRIA